MNHFPLSLFYDLQLFVQHSNFYRKYYLLFKSLDLSTIPDKNYGVGRTGYSRHAMIRAFVVKHFEEIKSVPRLVEFLDAHPPSLLKCAALIWATYLINHSSTASFMILPILCWKMFTIQSTKNKIFHQDRYVLIFTISLTFTNLFAFLSKIPSLFLLQP